MTETADWAPTFERVGQIPGTNSLQPPKNLAEQQAWINRRNAANIAVAMGGVDTGDDWDPWGWLAGWSGGVSDSITEHTEAIANLEDIAATATATPAWVTNIDDMATIPRIGVGAVAIAADNTGGRPKYVDVLDGQATVTGSSGAGAIKYLYFGVPATIKPIFTGGSSKGHIYYAPIVVDRTGQLGDMRWMVGADTAIFSINYYEAALCVYNPDNGNIEKLWGSGNIKDGVASTTTFGEVVIDMGLDDMTTPGQVLFAATQQTAPGLFQDTRRLGVAPTPNLGRADTLLDAWCYIAPNYSQGIPSSIALSSLTRENRFVPWMSVSVAA